MSEISNPGIVKFSLGVSLTILNGGHIPLFTLSMIDAQLQVMSTSARQQEFVQLNETLMLKPGD